MKVWPLWVYMLRRRLNIQLWLFHNYSSADQERDSKKERIKQAEREGDERAGWKQQHMVPHCHKQALWKDRGHLFNHGIPEESQRDTQFVPLLLNHKFNCFTWTPKKWLIRRLKKTRGSRWIYVQVCLWSELCVRVCVCVRCFRWIAITAILWYLWICKHGE